MCHLPSLISPTLPPICRVAKTAIECLNEARRDCDNGYDNLPEFIIKGLEEKKSNVTAYKTTYCGEKTTHSTQEVKQGIYRVTEHCVGIWMSFIVKAVAEFCFAHL